MLRFLATELVNAEARIKDLETRHAEDGPQIKTLETQLARQASKLRSYTDKERRVLARVFEMFTEAKKELECKEKSLADFLDQMLLDAGNIDHLQVTYEDPPENATTSTVQLHAETLDPATDPTPRVRLPRNVKIAPSPQPQDCAAPATLPPRSGVHTHNLSPGYTSFLFSSRPHDLPVIATPRPTFNDRIASDAEIPETSAVLMYLPSLHRRLGVNETQLDRLTATRVTSAPPQTSSCTTPPSWTSRVTGASVSGDQTGQDQGKPRHIRKHNRTQKRLKREATRRCETLLKL
ncbi:hypothetical protein B0H14DRAFT_775589 [Mycena olivaceomarginata]|nr:hypothetical protein B0H14DRAFT_775589 [Mycena olivaceomarginata]